MAKVKIDKYDTLRVMLTDTLPYEVPINFLNEGIYFYFRSQDKGTIYFNPHNGDIATFLNKFLNLDGYTKPYNYRINKNSKSKRLLSIPHPAIQKNVTELYREYDALITDLCSRSPVSLRAPHKVASRFYEKELANYSPANKAEGVDTETNAFEQTSIYASSYFTYKKYNFLYKFYDSYESQRIEKKFECLTRYDISKCFHNIYVPSLGWSIKGREFSKKYSHLYSFESEFQKIMEFANDRELSGILVGPEFSRIFAEIILQHIDRNIIERIKNDKKLRFGNDYTLRRYVDDYFLYTKNHNISKEIMDLVIDELEQFKLFINESKTEITEVPYITGLTIAKMDVKELVRNTFLGIVKENNEIIEDVTFVKSLNPSREANRFIKNLKKLVKLNNVNYESLTGYTLSELRRRMIRIIEDPRVIDALQQGNTDSIMKLLIFVLESSFFIYSMDIRVRTTYIITQIVVRLNLLSEIGTAEFRDNIRKKIYDESVLLLSKMKDKGKANSIETLNLLISIKTNFEDYPISTDKLIDLFDLRLNDVGSIEKKALCNIGYFQIMVLSSFIENSYPHITRFLEKEILDRIDETDGFELTKSTELTLTMFDSFSNPYFSQLFKERLINIVCIKIGVRVDQKSVLNFVTSKEWFFTWVKGNLAQILMKKELRSPY
jgi:hypothetical protein